MKFIKYNLIGKKFGRLLVIEEAEKFYVKGGTMIRWKCLCDCGKIKIIRASDLLSGSSKSCGCATSEAVIKRCSSHGLIHTLEYNAWAKMKSRCYYEKTLNFKDWGGRGIRVCDRWINSFENFLEDMGKKPSKNHSLDRFPDINGNYEPNNCRWATKAEQNRGKRNNKYFEYNGNRMVLVDWARKFHVSHSALSRYIKKNGVQEAMEYYHNKCGIN